MPRLGPVAPNCPVPEQDLLVGRVHGRGGADGLDVQLVVGVAGVPGPPLASTSEAGAALAEALPTSGLEAGPGVVAARAGGGEAALGPLGAGEEGGLVEEQLAKLDLLGSEGVAGILGDGVEVVASWERERGEPLAVGRLDQRGLQALVQVAFLRVVGVEELAARQHHRQRHQRARLPSDRRHAFGLAQTSAAARPKSPSRARVLARREIHLANSVLLKGVSTPQGVSPQRPSGGVA